MRLFFILADKLASLASRLPTAFLLRQSTLYGPGYAPTTRFWEEGDDTEFMESLVAWWGKESRSIKEMMDRPQQYWPDNLVDSNQRNAYMDKMYAKTASEITSYFNNSVEAFIQKYKTLLEKAKESPNKELLNKAHSKIEYYKKKLGELKVVLSRSSRKSGLEKLTAVLRYISNIILAADKMHPEPSPAAHEKSKQPRHRDDNRLMFPGEVDPATYGTQPKKV